MEDEAVGGIELAQQFIDQFARCERIVGGLVVSTNSLPFAGGDGNKIPLVYRSFGPDEGLRGHCVAPNGDIYVIRSVGHYVGASLDVYGPDGKLKKAGFVAGLGAADSGLGLDGTELAFCLSFELDL